MNHEGSKYSFASYFLASPPPYSPATPLWYFAPELTSGILPEPETTYSRFHKNHNKLKITTLNQEPISIITTLELDPTIYPECSYKVSISLYNGFLNCCVFMNPIVVPSWELWLNLSGQTAATVLHFTFYTLDSNEKTNFQFIINYLISQVSCIEKQENILRKNCNCCCTRY